MLCCHCQKNEAVRKYRKIKEGKVVEENYCFECYHHFFSSQQVEVSTEEKKACPYCGTTETEFHLKKLVGCANCYYYLKDAVVPVMHKMQGKKTHKGKFPTLEGDGEIATFEGASEEEILKTRIERQGRELALIIEKLKSEGCYKQAKGYADKFSLMQSQGRIEEDFVWRCDSEI